MSALFSALLLHSWLWLLHLAKTYWIFKWQCHYFSKWILNFNKNFMLKTHMCILFLFKQYTLSTLYADALSVLMKLLSICHYYSHVRSTHALSITLVKWLSQCHWLRCSCEAGAWTPCHQSLGLLSSNRCAVLYFKCFPCHRNAVFFARIDQSSSASP
jgi:hypothetical protein